MRRGSHNAGPRLSYCVANKTKQTKTRTTPRPTIRSLNTGGMRVKHREFCSSVDLQRITSSQQSATGEKIPASPLKLPINPGDGQTFPWLSSIARRYEKYVFKKIKFVYVPQVSTLANGRVIMTPVYDPAEEIPTDLRYLYNASDTRAASVYQHCEVMLPSGKINKELYVRELSELANIDERELRTSDVGYLAVSLSETGATLIGTSVPVAFGDIFVEYEVELRSPRVGDRAIRSFHFVQDGSKFAGGGTARHASLFNFSHTLKPPELQAIPDASGHQHTTKNNTLALRTGHISTGPYTHSDTVDPVELSQFVFHEPFSGLMSLHADTSPLGIPYPPTITANGVRSDGATGKLVHPSPLQHSSPVVDHIRTIADGVNSAVAMYKVVAEAGDSVLAFIDNAGTAISDWGHTAEAIFTEMAPEVLEGAALLL